MTREEAIILLNATKQMSCNEKCEPISDLYYALDMAIKALEQKPKTGHWKPTIVRGSESYICSECSAECCYATTNYCPNCGVRMESEE